MQAKFNIVIVADGDTPYLEDAPGTYREVMESIKLKQDAIFTEVGITKFVFDNEDELLVLDPDGSVIFAWNRDQARDIAAYADFTMNGISRTEREPIGWQIVDSDGYNIHADENDPFGLNSFDILVEDAAETARAWVAENPGFGLLRVYEGDIEEPDFVEVISVTSPGPEGPGFSGLC